MVSILIGITGLGFGLWYGSKHPDTPFESLKNDVVRHAVSAIRAGRRLFSRVPDGPEEEKKDA